MSHRRKLPRKAMSTTWKEKVAGISVFLTVAHYDEERTKPGAIFIDMMKEGSPVAGMMTMNAIMSSLFLQYGGSVDRIVQQMKGTKFPPSDHVYSSVFDAIASVLEAEYLTKKESV